MNQKPHDEICEVLLKIAGALTDMEADDLTQAEITIFGILNGLGFLVNDNGTIKRSPNI